MALPVWPSSLPELRGDANSAGATISAPPKATTFDDGPPRTRRKKVWRAATIVVPLVFESGFPQLSTFKGFVETDLNDGAKAFRGPVWLADGTTGIRTCRITTLSQVTFRSPQIPAVTLTLAVEAW